jgi:hypothetical protein
MVALFRSVVTRSAEVALSLLLVATCSVLFVGLLSFSFPHGTSLRELANRGEARTFEAALETRRLSVRDGGAGTAIATLERKHRRVKDKPSGGIAWRDAEQGMPLGNGHSIQTFDRSDAVIAFDEENALELRANSLVVLKRLRGPRDGEAREATLVMLGGEMSGLLRGGAGRDLQVRVQTPGGEARIRSRPEGSGAAFHVQMNDDESATISVFDGVAEVESPAGPIRIEADRALDLPRSGPVKAPRALPAAPRPREPAAGAEIPFRAQAPPIAFRWAAVEGCETYRFVLTTDALFRDRVQEVLVRGTELTQGNLAPGRYFWRASSLADGLESAPGPSSALVLVRDETPPALEIQWPSAAVSRSVVIVTGRAEPGARVFVANRATPVSASGDFSCEVDLERGTNVVVVEAIDAAGNATYRSEMVAADY